MFARALVTVAAVGGLVSGSAFAQMKYEPGEYKIDPAHSKVGFEIPHLVISSVEGRFTKFDGTFQLNQSFEKSSAKANVDVASIDTGVSQRDDHLRSADFFDVAKHPTMTFESTNVKGKPESFKLEGNLTLKGVTKKVTFDAKYLGSVKDAQGNQKAAFAATTKINRKDFGLTWSKMVEAGPVVGDEMTIELKLQGAKAEAAKK